jgi:hypothetical protein
MKDYKKIVRLIGFHGGVLLKGFIKMLYGATMAMLATVAIYGFSGIPSEGGYIAVSSFLLSTCTMIVALGGIYYMGIGSMKETKK